MFFYFFFIQNIWNALFACNKYLHLRPELHNEHTSSLSSHSVTFLFLFAWATWPVFLRHTKKWFCWIIQTPKGLGQSIIHHCQPMLRFVYVMIYWIQFFFFPFFFTDKFIEFLTDGVTELTDTSEKCLPAAVHFVKTLTESEQWLNLD